MSETTTDLIARLDRTLTTMMNDDLSAVGTEKRIRHIERTGAVQDAAAWITAALAREAGLISTFRAIRHEARKNRPDADKIYALTNAAMAVKP